MELKHIAARSGRLSSFLREEMGMSAGLMNRLKWKEGLFVNGTPVHTDYAVQAGDVIVPDILGLGVDIVASRDMEKVND